MFQIWPSLISADLLHLADVIDTLSPLCSGFHIDIMDNHFVPNLTWGAQFANTIAAYSKKPTWVHLMVSDPASFFDRLVLKPGSYITIHIENKGNIRDMLKEITRMGMYCSIALNPETPADAVEPYLDLVQQILIMSVKPGFSGQQVIPETFKKIAQLKARIAERNLIIDLALDGGISRENIATIKALGANQCAIASGIFDHENPARELATLH